MTKRSATYWCNQIATYESANPHAEVFTENDGQGDYSVTVIGWGGYQYHLYNSDDCRKWLNDAY